MPTFRTEIPAEGKHHGFKLRRTPTTGSVHAIITCPDLIVCDTHFWHGRTTPCERIVNDAGETIDDGPCPPCHDKIPWRTHVYVSAFDAKTVSHFIYECTTHAGLPLQEYRQANGSLRGCIFRATRPLGTANGKVVIETSAANLQKVPLPEAPSLLLCLSVIWRLPLTGLALELDKTVGMNDRFGYATRNPTVKTREAKLAEQRTQPDNQPDPPTIGGILGGNGHAKREKTPE